MTTAQLEFGFEATVKASGRPRRIVRPEVRENGREHFKTTTLTVSRRDFERVAAGERIWATFCNDLISSCRGEGDNSTHHSIRRIELLNRQWRGGFVRAKIRHQQGFAIECELLGAPVGDSDASCGSIEVVRKISEEQKQQ